MNTTDKEIDHRDLCKFYIETFDYCRKYKKICNLKCNRMLNFRKKLNESQIIKKAQKRG